MAFEKRDDSGALFKARKEPETERHPAYDGDFKIICPHCNATQEGWISGWVKTAKTGNKFFSLAFKHKRAGQ